MLFDATDAVKYEVQDKPARLRHCYVAIVLSGTRKWKIEGLQ